MLASWGRLIGVSTAIWMTAAACAVQDGDGAESGPVSYGIDHALQLQSMVDPQIDPSGQWIAYVVGSTDEDEDKGRSRIWMSSVDGETHIPMTAKGMNASRPRWSPDGRFLAFIGRRGDGDTKSQVWTLDRRGGEARAYTAVKQGVDSYDWAPDSQHMLLMITDPDPNEETDGGEDGTKDAAKKDGPKPVVIDRLQFKRDYAGYLNRQRSHIYVSPGRGEDPVQLTSGDYDDEDAVWSPDGAYIAFSSKRDGDPDGNDNSDIFVVAVDLDAGDHPLTQVTSNKGPDGQPTWSPDGQFIAHLAAYEPEKLWYDTVKLAISPAVGGAPKVLAADFDYMVRSPRFAPDGQSVLVSAALRGDNALMRMPVDGSAPTRIDEADGSTYRFSLGSNGQIAAMTSGYDQPTALTLFKDGTDPLQIRAVNDDLLKDVTIAPVQRLKVAGWNGDSVESFVYYPANYTKGQPHPTIFLLHGGPVAQYDSGFDSWAQILASAGYVTVLPNPHGSSGYGHDFTYALNRQWGVPDTADVNAIADHLVAEGIADPDRLGVGGWSYGGILTNYMITNTTRFAGAVSGASVVNYRANYGHDHYQLYWETELGLPWENPEAWEAISPFNDVGKITTPTLVMGGALDWNVPIQNSEQLYQALKRRGIDTQLVVYPGEHHGIRRPSFRRDRLERWVAWFDRTVKGESAD